MNGKTLTIDTSEPQKVRLELEIGDYRTEKISGIVPARAQEVLPLVEQILKENKLKFRDITEIKVNTGPGSFTGLRVGVSIANMLGALLKIPVNGQPPGQPVFPRYAGSKYAAEG